MRPRFRFLLVTCLLAATILPVFAAGAQDQSVYTWVDKNGVRHYSDQPANAKAKLLTLAAPAPASVRDIPLPVAPSSSAPRAVSVAPATESPAARAARCTKLRGEVARLQSARRVRVNENGKSRYLAGDDLVKFKAQMTRKMHQACAAPTD
ncbi:MAG: DUF4124 domain-containing protein [Gammaproteobacteria bacterium]